MAFRKILSRWGSNKWSTKKELARKDLKKVPGFGLPSQHGKRQYVAGKLAEKKRGGLSTRDIKLTTREMMRNKDDGISKRQARRIRRTMLGG